MQQDKINTDLDLVELAIKNLVKTVRAAVGRLDPVEDYYNPANVHIRQAQSALEKIKSVRLELNQNQ